MYSVIEQELLKQEIEHVLPNGENLKPVQHILSTLSSHITGVKQQKFISVKDKCPNLPETLQNCN